MVDYFNKKILLVEDDRAHREFVSQILENMGCKVVVAFDGEEAIEFLKKDGFDIILMDLLMPKIDGIEAAKIIRDMKRHGDIPNIPIVAISASQDEATETACLEAGMDGFIPKSLWKPKWEPQIRAKLVEVLG